MLSRIAPDRVNLPHWLPTSMLKLEIYDFWGIPIDSVAARLFLRSGVSFQGARLTVNPNYSKSLGRV